MEEEMAAVRHQAHIIDLERSNSALLMKEKRMAQEKIWWQEEVNRAERVDRLKWLEETLHT